MIGSDISSRLGCNVHSWCGPEERYAVELCVVFGVWWCDGISLPPTHSLSSYYCSELNNSPVSGGTDTIQSVRSHTSPRHYHSHTMRLLRIFLSAGIIAATNAQFFNAIRNLFSPVTNLFGGGRFVDDGTQSPQSTGREELFPSDCGRDPQDGTGKLCFPDGLLCQNSE